MPSSPKVFHSRISSPATRLTRSTLLIAFSAVLFLFSLYTFVSSRGCGNRCLSDLRTVRVLWDRPGNVDKGGADGGDADNGIRRHKVMGLLGSKPGSVQPVGDGR
ncbi:hypothetical protein V6N13_117568 [Hibiscus sabdariffa]